MMNKTVNTVTMDSRDEGDGDNCAICLMKMSENGEPKEYRDSVYRESVHRMMVDIDRLDGTSSNIFSLVNNLEELVRSREMVRRGKTEEANNVDVATSNQTQGSPPHSSEREPSSRPSRRRRRFTKSRAASSRRRRTRDPQ